MKKRILDMNNKKLKVLMIEHFSSSNNYTIDLCRELNKYADVTLLTVNNSTIKDEKFLYKKILFGTSNHNSIIKIILYAISIIKMLINILIGSYDIVHVQTFRIPSIEVKLYKFVRPFINKLVFTLHNVKSHENSKESKDFLSKMCIVSDKVIVHNEESKKILLKEYKDINDNKIVVIPHGIYNMKHINYKKDNEKINFITFGLIRYYKGIDILIEAINILPQEIKKKVHFTIAGKQDVTLDSTDYSGMIQKYNLNETITFIPKRISDEEVQYYFNTSDFCILPYRNIYGSGALLMSYTFNTPVIVSDVPVFIEETNNGLTGLIFKNGNIEDLSEKIINAIDLNKDEIRIKKNEIKLLVDKKYNWKESALKTIECYIQND